MLPATLLECKPHVSRIQITSGLIPTTWFVSTRPDSVKLLVVWIPLRIRLRSRNTQPYFEGYKFNVRVIGHKRCESHGSQYFTDVTPTWCCTQAPSNTCFYLICLSLHLVIIPLVALSSSIWFLFSLCPPLPTVQVYKYTYKQT